ncbi:MAG: histidine phosphatase family protein [Nocardioidaceae bacterium]
MSDLFCAATLVVARHAEAEYDAPVASDAGGSLTTIGRAQARALGESLLARRIAAIWCSDMSRAVQTAEIAAAVLDVPVSVRAGLHEFAVGELAGQPFGPALLDPVYKAWMSGDLSVGCPGAETGADVFERNRDVLQSIVDQFRGETVLIVGHGGSIGLTLPRLAHNVANDFAWSRMLDNCATCEVVADADGWVLQTWGGEPVG